MFELSSGYIFPNLINPKSDWVDSNPIQTRICPALVVISNFSDVLNKYIIHPRYGRIYLSLSMYPFGMPQ